MSKLSRREIDEETAFEWEEMYGTEHTEWFPEYNMWLPYWVAFMPNREREEYISRLKNEFR